MPQRPKTAGPQRSSNLDRPIIVRRRTTLSVDRVRTEEDDEDLRPADFTEIQPEGDEAGATKPYIGTIVAMTPKGFKMPS